MPDQAAINLKYLNHALRNGTVSIQACLREVETILKDMNKAIKSYIADLESDTKTMKNQKLIESIKRHEGLRLKPYLCTAGKLTIGYGRNLDDRGLSKREAEIMLAADIDIAKQELCSLLPESVNLSENRLNVLVNMVFNLGTARFAGFKKMCKAVKDGDFQKAADEMLDSKWAQQVGDRAIELAQIMREG